MRGSYEVLGDKCPGKLRCGRFPTGTKDNTKSYSTHQVRKEQVKRVHSPGRVPAGSSLENLKGEMSDGRSGDGKVYPSVL